jgi:hypothetical protein
MLFIITNTMRNVLEATLRHVAKPTRRVALALHLITLAISNYLSFLLAELTQHLKVNTVIAEFLFHRVKGITILAITKTFCPKIDYSWMLTVNFFRIRTMSCTLLTILIIPKVITKARAATVMSLEFRAKKTFGAHHCAPNNIY